MTASFTAASRTSKPSTPGSNSPYSHFSPASKSRPRSPHMRATATPPRVRPMPSSSPARRGPGRAASPAAGPRTAVTNRRPASPGPMQRPRATNSCGSSGIRSMQHAGAAATVPSAAMLHMLSPSLFPVSGTMQLSQILGAMSRSQVTAHASGAPGGSSGGNAQSFPTSSPFPHSILPLTHEISPSSPLSPSPSSTAHTAHHLHASSISAVPLSHSSGSALYHHGPNAQGPHSTLPSRSAHPSSATGGRIAAMAATAVAAAAPPAAAGASGAATAGISSGLSGLAVPRVAPTPSLTSLTIPRLEDEVEAEVEAEGEREEEGETTGTQASSAVRSFLKKKESGRRGREEWWEKEGPVNMIEMDVETVADYEQAVREAAMWCAGRYEATAAGSVSCSNTSDAVTAVVTSGYGSGAVRLPASNTVSPVASMVGLSDLTAVHGGQGLAPEGSASTAATAAAAAATIATARMGDDCAAIPAVSGSDSSSYIVVGDLQAARAVQAGARFLTHAPIVDTATHSGSGSRSSAALLSHTHVDLSSSSYHGLLSDPTAVDAAWHLVPSAAAGMVPHSASPPPSVSTSSLPARQPLVVVKFYASWCRACRGVLPPLQKLAARHPDVLFLKVNLSDNRDLHSALGIKILPFFRLFKQPEGMLDAFTTTMTSIPRLEKAVVKYKGVVEGSTPTAPPPAPAATAVAAAHPHSCSQSVAAADDATSSSVLAPALR